MGIPEALIASAVIGAGSSYYQSEKQAEAIRKQEEELRRQEEERQKELERIARETRPMGETVKSVKFGAGTKSTSIGSANDFLVPLDTSKSQLGTSASGGLGFIL